MIKSINKKTVLALIFAVVSIVYCCIPAYAESAFEKEQLYFDYSDGVVRDGDRNDRPGIIGDELEREDNARNARASEQTAQGRTIVFWGITVAMIVAAAIILLIALAVPGRNQNR